jgi:penicillin-binding protein 2
MLIFDQLKKDDPRLRGVAVMVLAGVFLLLGGLWWVQVVSGRHYQTNLEDQSFRTVRIPAVRGKITDRNGLPLAENRPTYNLSLYFEELRKPFDNAYLGEITRSRAELKQKAEEREKALGRRLTKTERKEFVLSAKEKLALRQKARSQVASNVVSRISERLREPLIFDAARFEKHYQTRLALPYPVLTDLTPTQIARFQEQSTSLLGADIEMLSTRVYPYDQLAAHVLGYLRRDDSSAEGEESFFSYRLPDYRGRVGVEGGYDRELRGAAGAKSVLVNNVGYRQSEQIWSPTEPGGNVILTIDAQIQRAAEAALNGVFGPTTTGAVVVVQVQTGDILAMASSPTFNPNLFVERMTHEEYQRIVQYRAEMNLATQDNFAPGSIFKMVVGLAALDAGLNPEQIYHAPANPAEPDKACYYIGSRPIRDTAPPGDYQFRRALKLSSNSYFIHAGLGVGVQKIVELGHRFHLGERFGLTTRQEVAGYFPPAQRLGSGWTDGNTANVCIGQDPILVTPLQIAVMTAAIANGGKVLWPRLVDRIEFQDASTHGEPRTFRQGWVRDELPVRPESLKILHGAMLADVEDADGTGRDAAVPGLRICGKTGTAQVKNEQGVKTGQTTWFASFAPFGSPRYAVVVMVVNGASGGKTCAPVAGKVYRAILERERNPAEKAPSLAGAN